MPETTSAMPDLIVAGGGPVGLATALYAARAGLHVVVREPRTGPIDKACGEGLLPGAVAAFAELGLDLPGCEITGIRYLRSAAGAGGTGDPAEALFAHGPGRGVRRTALHTALGDAVHAAGITVESRRVATVRQEADHVVVDGQPARYLVGADGLHSPVRHLVGLEPAERHAHRRFGLRCHADVAPWTSLVEVHWADRSEAYVTPVAPDQIGVAILTGGVGRSFAEALLDHPALAERLAGHELGRVRGAGPLRQRSRRRVAGRVLLVGDAAGYVDAVTGEGISLGLAQARAVVDAVVADDPAAYERAYRGIGRRHELLTKGLVAATRLPVVRRRLVPTARVLPSVFSAAVNQLARPA